jgi:hypothetical protein
MTTAVKYTDGVYVYYVAPDKTGKFFTFCRDTEDQFVKPSIFSPVASGSTFEAAQAALDTYARQNGKLEPSSTMDSGSEMGQETFADIPAKNEESVPPADVTPKMEQGDDDDNSADDGAEPPPQTCDWRNASGGDSEDNEDGPENKPEEVSGDPLDLRGDEFDYIIAPANTALNRFVAMLHAKKQHDGEINIKVTFEDNSGSYIFGGAVSGKINLTMKPQKVTGDAVELQFDAQGNPVIPSDREHQMNFDEMQPEDETSGGTVTVDGKTGVVEKYQEDGQQGQDKPSMDEQPGTNESEDESL